MTDDPERKKIGLVLGSGGARGAAHIGVLKVLENLKIPIDIVVGASMGSVVGGSFAAGHDSHSMEAEWTKKSVVELAKHFLPSATFKAWSNGRAVLDLFTELVGDQDIEDLESPYAAIATDLNSGSAHILNQGSLAEAMRASSSIPILFEPVITEEHCLVDGGLVNPLPIDIAQEMGADLIIAVDVNARPISLWDANDDNQDSETPNLFESLSATSILFQRQLAKNMISTRPPDLYLTPDSYAGIFGYQDVQAIIDSGESEASEKKSELLALIE